MFHEVSVCYHSETAFDCGERGWLSQVSTSSGHCRHTSAQHLSKSAASVLAQKSQMPGIPLQQRPPKKWKSLWRMLYIYIYHYIYIYIYLCVCVMIYHMYMYIYICMYIYYISTKLAKSPLAPYKAGPWSLAPWDQDSLLWCRGRKGFDRDIRGLKGCLLWCLGGHGRVKSWEEGKNHGKTIWNLGWINIANQFRLIRFFFRWFSLSKTSQMLEGLVEILTDNSMVVACRCTNCGIVQASQFLE